MDSIYLGIFRHSHNWGVARCREMLYLLAGYLLQCKVATASNSGSLGFIVCGVLQDG